MKKLLVIILMICALLIGCEAKEPLSSDFKLDLEQVLPIIENVHEKELSFTEDEDSVLDSFKNKYKYGQYYIDGEDDYYEMNDLEKSIFNVVNTMIVFAEEHDMVKTALASEKDDYDLYSQAKEELNKLMEIKNINRLPEEYKGKYPTYEKVGIYPEQFEKDIKEIIDLFDPIVNGYEGDVTDDEWGPLESFYYEYKAGDKYGPHDYEQDGKHYLVNTNMLDAIKTVKALVEDINREHISGDTIEQFNYLKEDIELLGQL